MQKAGATLRNIDKVVRAATLQAMTNASDDIQSNSRDVTHNWRSKIEFDDAAIVDPKRIEILIRPKGRAVRIFKYVDLGTKGPYLIPKMLVPGRMLHFQAGYSARTAPVAKYNVGSGQHFGAWVSKKQVTHPGIRKRLFMQTFMKELIPPLPVRVETEIAIRLS